MVGLEAKQRKNADCHAQVDKTSELCKPIVPHLHRHCDCLNTKGLERLACLGFQPEHILDIGANVGDWTRETLKLFPDASFTLFDGADHMNDWRDLINDKIVGTSAILDSKDHEVEWFASGGSTGNSLLKEVTGHFQGVRGQTVQAQALDSLLDKKQWGHTYELVKIDVQGAELAVFEGAPKVLSHAEVIKMELPFAAAYNKGAPSFVEFVVFMGTAGFLPFDAPERHNMFGVEVQIDFIWVRKDSRWHKVNQCATEARGLR